jgi:hypothetical protein
LTGTVLTSSTVLPRYENLALANTASLSATARHGLLRLERELIRLRIANLIFDCEHLASPIATHNKYQRVSIINRDPTAATQM